MGKERIVFGMNLLTLYDRRKPKDVNLKEEGKRGVRGKVCARMCVG